MNATSASGAVSVVVPTFNRAQYIEECLNSLFHQTVPPLEIIVVDDGSTDGTAELLERYKHRIQYLRKDNGGKASALNVAMQHVRGDYVWLFDDDDVALPDSIEKRSLALEANPQVGFVFSGHYLGFDGPNGRVVPKSLYELPAVADSEIFLRLMTGCYFTLPSILARRSVYNTVGPFDELLLRGQDYDMMIRLAKVFPCIAVYEPTFIVRNHDGPRGPMSRRHGESTRKELFREYEQIIGRKLRENVPLDEYLIPRTSLDVNPAALRRALFSRMLVMASKGLVGEMLEDLASALDIDHRSGELTAWELGQCASAICTGYAYDSISADWPAYRAGIERVLTKPGGKGALRALALGLFRMAKSYPGSIRKRLRWLCDGMRTVAVSVSLANWAHNHPPGGANQESRPKSS